MKRKKASSRSTSKSRSRRSPQSRGKTRRAAAHRKRVSVQHPPSSPSPSRGEGTKGKQRQPSFPSPSTGEGAGLPADLPAESKAGSVAGGGEPLPKDGFGVRGALKVGGEAFTIFRLVDLEKRSGVSISRLPYSIRILLENLLRNEDGRVVEKSHIETLLKWNPRSVPEGDIPFLPARVILQDFTGVPVVVDLAAMRDTAKRLGSDPKKINPLFPVDLVIDHSVQVDAFGSPDSFARNADLEYERNRERYTFLKWGQKAFKNFRVVPPETGIVHQVNLEHLASVVTAREVNGVSMAFPDTLVGTDSHTTMINGLGVVGWGVGGIEAEAAMLGQPFNMPVPPVVGFRLTGRLSPGATATDLVLTVTQMLRKRGVVEKFVEFCGSGLDSLSLADRATISNMCPEYGATVGFFPVDQETLEYLTLTGRPKDMVNRVEAYCKEQGLFRTASAPEPEFSDLLELDLAAVEPSIAGPKRPHDRVPLRESKKAFREVLTAPVKERGFELAPAVVEKCVNVELDGQSAALRHGSIVIAAITSCTNTSNPAVLVGAGLLAKRASERGLRVPKHVKTSLAPGSRVVVDYLKSAGLLEPLERLNFHLVGFGCTTCIGNSGPLPEPIVRGIQEGNLVAAAVLSGNRNFEGRIHANVRANYLASPPLVVAFALAGRVDIDFESEPLGTGLDGKPVFLREIWPVLNDVRAVMGRALNSRMFSSRYASVFEGDGRWNALKVEASDLYAWDSSSTYIQSPPFFEGMTLTPPALADIAGARVLAVLGDSVTTDHISPAGSIGKDSPAGRYLIQRGVSPKDFNQYGARRGSHDVMMRGTFANVRLKNLLLPGVEGSVTVHMPDGAQMSIFDAAMQYRKEGVPSIILAGKEYGSGSSRDWAAKGPSLLGVRAVIAESYERIHRSNLVGMGVLPLQFESGQSRESLGLTGRETFDIVRVSEGIEPRKMLTVRVKTGEGKTTEFRAIARLNTRVEVEYYRHGGILQAVLRHLCAA
ncbi:MAG: aconitate hydratase AcnA [Nitrospirae bacterium]|nr:aconitate hydratase AcnA [Nitrospirota bacterium]